MAGNRATTLKVIRLQAALKIARDELRKIADGDFNQAEIAAQDALDRIDERMNKA